MPIISDSTVSTDCHLPQDNTVVVAQHWLIQLPVVVLTFEEAQWSEGDQHKGVCNSGSWQNVGCLDMQPKLDRDPLTQLK